MIETGRLKIQPIELVDAPFIYKLLNQESWIKFIGQRNINTLEDAENYIQNRFIAHFDEHGYGIYRVQSKLDNANLGIITLIRKPHLDSPDIGYAFLDEHNGQGYAVEATKAVFDYAQTDLKMTRIVAVVLENNPRSIRVLDKLGFCFEKKVEQGEEEFLLYVNQQI
jgi:[ribosomal protein S5]-alanine N-acetyltransferase